MIDWKLAALTSAASATPGILLGLGIYLRAVIKDRKLHKRWAREDAERFKTGRI